MPIVGLLLFLGFALGNTALLVVSLNWWYGNPLPKRLLQLLRGLHGLAVVAVPAAVAALWGFDLVYAVRTGALPVVVQGHVWLCWGMGLVVLPLVTLRRNLRRPAAALVSNHTRWVNVAKELGGKPVGRGKYAILSRLPGNECFQVELSVRTLRLPRLPAAWDGLTILHLSDLHFCGTPDRSYYRRVFDLCREWGEPDLLALTGDFVDSRIHHRWIVPLLGRLRWKTAALAVLGNHDRWRDHALIRRRLRKLGVDVLGNAWRQLPVRGEPLVAIGNETPWFRPAPDLAACPKGPFRLGLSHTPDIMPWARRHGIDLLLAGHNHGGQVRLPVIGSVLTPSLYSRRYDCGVFAEPPTVLHVSRGLAGQHPLRYRCRPEVTLLVLQRSG